MLRPTWARAPRAALPLTRDIKYSKMSDRILPLVEPVQVSERLSSVLGEKIHLILRKKLCRGLCGFHGFNPWNPWQKVKRKIRFPLVFSRERLQVSRDCVRYTASSIPRPLCSDREARIVGIDARI